MLTLTKIQGIRNPEAQLLNALTSAICDAVRKEFDKPLSFQPKASQIDCYTVDSYNLEHGDNVDIDSIIEDCGLDVDDQNCIAIDDLKDIFVVIYDEQYLFYIAGYGDFLVDYLGKTRFFG